MSGLPERQETVLAVDPGGTTGLALWESGQHTAWYAPWPEARGIVHQHLAQRDRDGGPWLTLLVVEDFIISQATLRKTRDGTKAIEFIGLARYLAGCYGVAFKTQTPAEAKTFSTDAKLRRAGWWTTSDHARDASRHLLLALVRRGAFRAELLVGDPGHAVGGDVHAD